jgi:hypothetical protein
LNYGLLFPFHTIFLHKGKNSRLIHTAKLGNRVLFPGKNPLVKISHYRYPANEQHFTASPVEIYPSSIFIRPFILLAPSDGCDR